MGFKLLGHSCRPAGMSALYPDAGQIVFAVLGVADLRCLPSVPIDVRSSVASYNA